MANKNKLTARQENLQNTMLRVFILQNNVQLKVDTQKIVQNFMHLNY